CPANQATYSRASRASHPVACQDLPTGQVARSLCAGPSVSKPRGDNRSSCSFQDCGHQARKLTKCFADHPVCPAKASILPVANDCKRFTHRRCNYYRESVTDGLDVLDTPIEYDSLFLGMARLRY